MMNTHTPIKKWLRWLVPALMLPFMLVHAGAAYMCETPPVTAAFISDIDNRINIIQGLLEKGGCSDKSKVTLFGFDFYPDPPDAKGNRDNLTGQIFNSGRDYLKQAAAVSYNEAFGLKEFFLSFEGSQDSYQLHLDAEQAQKRLNTLRDLLGMTQQACARDIKLDGMPIATYAESWYYTYRQMYFWLLLSSDDSIKEEYQKLSDSLVNNTTVQNTLQVFYLQMAAVRQKPEASKWYANTSSCSYAPKQQKGKDASLPQNFFTCNPFYTKEYADGLQAQCQSPNLNMQGLDTQATNLEKAVSRVGTTFTEIEDAAVDLGDTTTARFEDLSQVFTDGQIDSFVKVNTNLDKLGKALSTNLQDWLLPGEASSQAQKVVNKTSSPKTPSGKTPQATGLNAGRAGATIGSVLGQAFEDEQAVTTAREEAQGAMSVQLRDMLDIKQQTGRGLNDVNGELGKSLAGAKSMANDISTLCKRHQPTQGEECGEK